MMESAHSPTPNGDTPNNMPPTEDFDDPFPSPPLDDLVLSNNEQPQLGEGQNNKVGEVGASEADPWAIMAKAAGEDAHPTAASSTAPATTNNNDTSAKTAVPAVSASSQGGEPTLTHAEGETFTMPGTEQQNNNSQSGGSLADQIKGKIQEVDAKTGISTKASEINEQYHISEKWSNFQTTVIKPTTEKTVEKTTAVKEKVAPKIAEQWGSLKQNPNVMGISQKWGSVTSKVGAKLNETKEQVGESVEHWKEEQEKKKAMANSGVAADGSSMNGGSEASTKKPLINEQQKEQLQQNLEATKTKVVEGWTSGMSWVSQRIKAQHEHQQQQGAQQQQQQQPSGGDQEMNRLDSDGLPSSFRK